MTAPAPYAEVRRLANEGRFTEAAETWARFLWWREDAASTLWMTCPLAADRPRRQVAAEKARADLRVFTEAMWNDPSAAVGQLIATWPANESAAAGGAV